MSTSHGRAKSKPISKSGARAKLVVLPHPNPRKDIYRTRYRVHPLIQQKLVAKALLRQKADAAYEVYQALYQEWQDLASELDHELQRIAQGHDPWSDPIT